jgi:hypothetical protein
MRHLVWRVRLLALTEGEILVEQPATIGQPIELEPGIGLVAILAIGQNRWMFSTTCLGTIRYSPGGHRAASALRLSLPESVERCQRRSHYRVQTAELSLPEVEVWPLLEPRSVVLAERANELRFEQDGRASAPGIAVSADQEIMPEVGPGFTATLLNIGGGGVGLRVRPEDSHILARHKLYWLCVSLPPELTTPICATGKLAHTNVESTHHVYAGMAFDFSFNAGHQRFVVEQIRRYVARQQETQRARRLSRTA